MRKPMERGRMKLLVMCMASAAFFIIPAAQASAADTTQFTVTAGSLEFSAATAPDVPNFAGLTLDGSAQTLNQTMNSWEVEDSTGSGSGWNVNVQGDGTGSAIFKEYCLTAATDPCLTNGVGYVTTGESLAANSLTLDSTSADFTAQGGTTGTAPTHSCGTTCNVDSAGAVIVASAAADAGMGTYQASLYTGTSLAVSAPTTVKALSDDEAVYRVDLTWTLASGPS